MKVAVVQMRSTDNKKRNLKKALALADRALKNKAEFILFPEIFNYRGALKTKAQWQSAAEDIPGESTRPFMALAGRRRVFILLGSLYERVQSKHKVRNTSVLINSRGRIAAVYRKINLFDAVLGKKIIREAENLEAGRKKVVVRVKQFKAGLTICYDLRFPALYRELAKNRAQLICVPSSFTKVTGQSHWETLLRARAIENLCYVLAPNQTGKDTRGVSAYGNSMIIDPWGKILARASLAKEEIIYANLSTSQVEKARRILPAIHSRRRKSG